jgi:hypothetical protein
MMCDCELRGVLVTRGYRGFARMFSYKHITKDIHQNRKDKGQGHRQRYMHVTAITFGCDLHCKKEKKVIIKMWFLHCQYNPYPELSFLPSFMHVLLSRHVGFYKNRVKCINHFLVLSFYLYKKDDINKWIQFANSETKWG